MIVKSEKERRKMSKQIDKKTFLGAGVAADLSSFSSFVSAAAIVTVSTSTNENEEEDRHN